MRMMRDTMGTAGAADVDVGVDVGALAATIRVNERVSEASSMSDDGMHALRFRKSISHVIKS